MAIDESGEWSPPTSPKQDTLREECRRKKYVLASGPRLSTKTIGCLHCVAEHAWHTPGANIALITVSQTVGYDSGIWNDLTRHILPQWIAGDFGMTWVKEPFIMGLSKKPTCILTNSHGDTSTIQLESLQNEATDVENRFKPRRYSMIYVPELSTYRFEKTFQTWCECLRMIHLKNEQHLFLSCTNPADEGSLSWIYKIWFSLKDSEDADADPMRLALKRNLGRVDFTLADNKFDSIERIEELKSRYASDPDLYSRYIEGKWVTATQDALFHGAFRPQFHIRGEELTPANPDPDTLVPEDGCFSLLLGLDPGSRNCAAAILEQVTQKRAGKDVSVFKMLDELVVVGEDFHLDDYMAALVKKMDYWETVIGKPRKTEWRFWSDRMVFDMKIPFDQKYWHQAIFEASGGRIVLMAADRGRGSVAGRVDLFRKLLYEDRFFVSASCGQTIQMIKSIRRGRSSVAVIERTSPWKHIFDAITYAIASECFDEMFKNVAMSMKKQSEVGLVQVNL
jgi:hypothetical protein